METAFDPDAFIARVGQRLVEQFDDARAATTPSTVGTAMEQSARLQLEQLLPRGLAVGSGFVIDSYGGTSRQADIVLYEKDICPVFSINDTPETTYYPCECVVAVGEVKSGLDRRRLADAFAKVASVKRLRRYLTRHLVPDPDTGKQWASHRSYVNVDTGSLPDTTKDPGAWGRIYGFVLAGTARLSDDSLAVAFLELTGEFGEALSPNLGVVLTGAMLSWGKKTTEEPGEVRKVKGRYVYSVGHGGPPRYQYVLDAESAELLGVDSQVEPFRELVRNIRRVYYGGKTSDIRSLDRYFEKKAASAGRQVRIFDKAAVPQGPPGDDGAEAIGGKGPGGS